MDTAVKQPPSPVEELPPYDPEGFEGHSARPINHEVSRGKLTVQKVSHQVDIEIHLLCGLLFGHEDRNSTSDPAPGISSEIFSGAFFVGFGYQNPKVSAISSQHALAQRQLGRTADHGVAQKMLAIFNPWQAGLVQ